MGKIRYTVRFNRKNKVNKYGFATVQIECYLNGKRKFFDTQIKLKPNQWNEKKKEISTNLHPNVIQLNKHISDFISKLESYEMKFLNANRPFSLNMLDDVFNNNGVRTFNEFMSIEIEKNTLSAGTKKSHKTTLKRLNGFKSCIFFEDINFEFLRDLEIYFNTLTIKEKNKPDRKLSHNTKWKYFKNIKVYVNLAIDKNLISVDKYPFRKFKFTSKQTDRIYLTPDEIELIKTTEFPEKLILIRDLFLFAIYTGLRFSDVMSLEKKDIIILFGNEWIKKKMDKTNEIVKIPVYSLFNGEPLRIIKKYNVFGSSNIFPTLTNQFINRELKKIAEISEINKKITFHSARHTTATYLLYMGVPVTTVQAILGHKKLSTTQVYSHIIDQTIDKHIKAVNF